MAIVQKGGMHQKVQAKQVPTSDCWDGRLAFAQPTWV